MELPVLARQTSILPYKVRSCRADKFGRVLPGNLAKIKQ
jgi:hypothetical protein